MLGCTLVETSELYRVNAHMGWLRYKWKVGAYHDARTMEKQVMHCTRWLDEHGFASFFGCYNPDAGFAEPEDDPDFVPTASERALAPKHVPLYAP